jgi:hypothetical protein
MSMLLEDSAARRLWAIWQRRPACASKGDQGIVERARTSAAQHEA